MLATVRLLAWHQAKPCGKNAAVPELLHWRGEGLDRERCEWAHARHGNWRGGSASCDMAAIRAFSASIRAVNGAIWSKTILQISGARSGTFGVRTVDDLAGHGR
jgi:hypothetical protein